MIYIAERRGGCKITISCQRGILSTSHAIDTIVHDDGSHIDIASRRMDKMITADSAGVTVSHRHHYGKFRSAEFYAGGKGKGPSMKGMQGMKIKVAVDTGGTSNPGNCNDIIFIQTEVLNRTDHGAHYRAMTAAGAPQMREKSLPDIIFNGH